MVLNEIYGQLNLNLVSDSSSNIELNVVFMCYMLSQSWAPLLAKIVLFLRTVTHINSMYVFYFATLYYNIITILSNRNDGKCEDLGWACIPLVVETYGAWGQEAVKSFAQLASRLAISCSKPKSVVIHDLYGRLNTCLVKSVASAIELFLCYMLAVLCISYMY